jgi:hypothetical protein
MAMFGVWVGSTPSYNLGPRPVNHYLTALVSDEGLCLAVIEPWRFQYYTSMIEPMSWSMKAFRFVWPSSNQ